MKKMTFADWIKSDYIPTLNETCVCIDTQEIRYGDGINPWTKLVGDINVNKPVDNHNTNMSSHEDIRTAIDSKADKSEGAFFIEGSGTTDSTAKT